ncbi:hypothetical protein D1007_07138 [Hordeum vulgare]|nr:hypothetical protein D1007_07138 [Hordeum vulgare]
MMPHGDGNGRARTDAVGRLGESITAGNGSKDLSRRFSMSSSDDTNSNIMFSVPGSKKAKVLRSIRAGWQEGKERRTRNSKSLRRLQHLVSNMDKFLLANMSSRRGVGKRAAAAAGGNADEAVVHGAVIIVLDKRSHQDGSQHSL